MTIPANLLQGLIRKPNQYGALTPNAGQGAPPGTMVPPPSGPGVPSIQPPVPNYPSGPGGPSIQPPVPNYGGGPGSPSIQPPIPGVQSQSFGPGSNLIGQQILPGTQADTQTARGDISSSLAGLQNGPDRGQLAQQAYNEISQQSEPAFQQQLRQVGQDAAKFGRIGSGLTTSQLGDVASNRNQYLGNLQAQLATGAAGQGMQDRLSQLGGAQNAYGQLAGQDQQAYQNVLGERGYQYGLSEQANQDASGQNALLASLAGSYGNPQAGISGVANTYANQAQGTFGNAGNILGTTLGGLLNKQPNYLPAGQDPNGLYV